MKKLRRRDEAFVSQWRALAPERRRAIQRSWRRGVAVPSDDATLALAASAQADRMRAAVRPMNAVATLTLVALIVDGALSGLRWLAVAAGIALAADLALSAITYRAARLR